MMPGTRKGAGATGKSKLAQKTWLFKAIRVRGLRSILERVMDDQEAKSITGEKEEIMRTLTI